MDAKPAAPPLNLRPLLVALCVAVAAAGVTWQAWDMLGSARQPMLQGWDDSFYYFWLPSVVIDGDVDFSNQLEQCRSIDSSMREQAPTLARTPTGLLENKYPPGWALANLPFFLVAHALAPPGAQGFEPIYEIAVWLGQLLYAAAGLWLAVRVVARYYPAPLATSAVLLVWLASPLVYYQSTRLSMSHSQVFTLAVAVFALALRIRDSDARTRHWLLLGFCAALLVVTRNVAAVYLLAPVWLVAPRLRSFRAFGWLLAGAALPAAVQVAAWKSLYGSWLVYSYGGERFDFANLHLWEILFSPFHGWLYWHPLLLPAVVAFAVWAWRRPEGRGWLASLAIITVLNAAWPTWWLGSSFGHRGFEVPIFFAMLGFATLLHAAAPHLLLRRALLACAALAIAWNLALFALFLTQRIPRQAPVTYADAARALAGWFQGAP